MPAGQPLIYTLQTSATIDDTFAFIVQVFENGTEIGKYYLKPNSNNRAHFDLNRVIQGRTRVDEKVYGAFTLLFDYSALPYTRSNGNMNKYEVKIGEYTGTEALAQATKYIYVMDGYEQVSSGLHPSFSDYYGTASTKKFWLTDREPVNNVITIEAADDDEGFFAFINNNTVSDVTRLAFQLIPPTGAPTTLTKDLNTTNGAQLPSATSPVNGFLVYAGIMPAQVLTPIFSATSWKQITITPQNGSGTQEGNVLSIIRDCTDYKDQAVQVAFANSRGGWDYLKFEGRPGRSITTEEKTYRKALGNYDATTYTFQSFNPEVEAYQKTAKLQYILNGLFNVADSKLLPFLLRSRKVYAKIDGVWNPVTVTTSQATYKTTADGRLTQLALNVELAQVIRC
jgi:hypothetical protein